MFYYCVSDNLVFEDSWPRFSLSLRGSARIETRITICQSVNHWTVSPRKTKNPRRLCKVNWANNSTGTHWKSYETRIFGKTLHYYSKKDNLIEIGTFTNCSIQGETS